MAMMANVLALATAASASATAAATAINKAAFRVSKEDSCLSVETQEALKKAWEYASKSSIFANGVFASIEAARRKHQELVDWENAQRDNDQFYADEFAAAVADATDPCSMGPIKGTKRTGDRKSRRKSNAKTSSAETSSAETSSAETRKNSAKKRSTTSRCHVNKESQVCIVDSDADLDSNEEGADECECCGFPHRECRKLWEENAARDRVWDDAHYGFWPMADLAIDMRDEQERKEIFGDGGCVCCGSVTGFCDCLDYNSDTWDSDSDCAFGQSCKTPVTDQNHDWENATAFAVPDDSNDYDSWVCECCGYGTVCQKLWR